jgi:hypothetical protein
LGQTVRLEGSGFTGIKQILVNGKVCTFNPVFVTTNNIIFQIPSTVPTTEAPDDVRNTIKLVKSESNTFVLPFEIRAAAPSITDVSHTMPQAGDEITITGKGLQGVTSVLFPGNIEAATFTSDDEEGTWVKVIVPAGITESGSITVISANGGAYSPAYFNYKEGLIQNFDGVSTQAYIDGDVSDDLDVVIPATGTGPKSQGIYRSLNKDGKTIAAAAGANPVAKYWMNNKTKWPTILNSAIPVSAACEQVAVQMDIYFEGIWNSGNIRFVIADGYGATRYCMLYAPWESGGKRVEFESPKSWFTITLPFSNSSDYDGETFDKVLTSIADAKYDQGGPHLENCTINEVESEPTNLKVYFDNIRFVLLTTPAYSDFPDDDE